MAIEKPSQNSNEQNLEPSAPSTSGIQMPIVVPRDTNERYTENGINSSASICSDNLNEHSHSNPINISNQPSQNDEKEEIECCICLETMDTQEGAIINPCMHPFHYVCIMEWSKRSNTCPLCKAKFRKVIKIQKINDEVHEVDIPIEETVQKVPYQNYLPENYRVTNDSIRVRNVYGRNQYPIRMRILIIILSFFFFLTWIIYGALYLMLSIIYFQFSSTLYNLYGLVNAGLVIYFILFSTLDLAILFLLMFMIYKKKMLYLKIYTGLISVQTFISLGILLASAVVVAVLSRDTSVLDQFILPFTSISIKSLIGTLISIAYVKAIYPNTFCSCIPV